jgi:hypothetical protein
MHCEGKIKLRSHNTSTCNWYEMHCEGKIKLRSHNTSTCNCLIEVVTKAGLTNLIEAVTKAALTVT